MYYLHLFEDDATCIEQYTGESSGYTEPWNSYSMDAMKVRYNRDAGNYYDEYLTFEILTGGTVAWKSFGTGSTKTIQYSINDGEWTSITASSSTTINVQEGDLVRFKGTNASYGSSKNDYAGFEGGTAVFNIKGNIMSLVYGDDFANNIKLTGTYNFCSIFKKTNAISAKYLVLPATVLTTYCYRAMFSYTTTLREAPELPAMTLAQGCYWYMFEFCAITKAPDLLAPVLIRECYGNMFTGCENLAYIKCLAGNIETAPTSAVTNWCVSVMESGVFIQDARVTWPRGASGIPTNWKIIKWINGKLVVENPTG